MHFFYFDLFAVIIQEVLIVVVVVEGVMVASDVGDDKFDIWNRPCPNRRQAVRQGQLLLKLKSSRN
jgi:hypothetical protein